MASPLLHKNHSNKSAVVGGVQAVEKLKNLGFQAGFKSKIPP